MNCRWCGKTLSKDELEKHIEYKEDFNDFKFCMEECKENYLEFNNYVNKNKGKFAVMIILSMLGVMTLPVVGAVAKNKILFFIPVIWICIGFGLTLLLFPFCTTSTNSSLGSKKAIKLAKGMGTIFFVIGIIATIIFIIKII